MADKSLQKRSMRKAVDRVDVGVFGIPMRYAAWMRSKRASWGGLIAVTAAQAVAGTLIAVLCGMALGVPLNAFSITLLVCFAIGSAIGGPLSFLLWSLLLIGVTGVLAGFIGGAWVASPSWWRMLAANWAEGKSVPNWFLVAVPGWILLWVGGAYGIAKLVDRAYEAISLSISFKAAARFSKEDQRIHDEAYAESNVTPVESRSLIDNGSDGTDSLIAGTPQVVEPGVRLVKDVELGGEPDTPAPSYDSLLDEDMDDPDVRRAMGYSTDADAGDDAPGTAAGIVIERDEPAQDGSPTLPPELSEPDLPALPADTGAPLRKVTPPKVDALASRAMSKKLQQLLTSFEMALFQNEDEGFIRDNQDELALISEEQKAMLRAMDNSGPLLSAIAGVQSERASEFLMGRSSPPSVEGTGVVPTEASDASEVDLPSGRDADVPVGAGEEDEPEESQQAIVADSIATMGDIFSSFARAPRGGAPVPAEDVSAETPETAEVAEAVEETAAEEPAETEPVVVDTPQETPKAPEPVVVNGFIIPRPPGEESEPVASVADAVVEDAGSDEADVEDVDAPDGEAAEGSEDEAEAPLPVAVTTDGDAGGSISTTDANGKVVVFEMDIEEPAAPAPVEADAGQEKEENAQEDDMSALVFTRIVCKQVLGLISGSLPPFEKANDVLEFERESGVSVAQVLNSRSFDEHVGSSEAVAARHSWMDVQRVLSQSSVERLVADFERLNARGQAMVEEPHTLTPPAFYAFEADCTRMLTAAGANDDTLAASIGLMQSNHDILEALRGIKLRREQARTQSVPETPPSVVRQRVPAGEDVDATRGRGMLSSVLGGARKGRDLLRSGDARRSDGVSEGDVVVDVVEAAVPEPQSPAPLEEVTLATRVPSYGDEDYKSPHAIGTDEYDLDMNLHGQAVEGRRKIAAARQAEADRIERERQEEADRVERERVEAEEQAERDRQAAVDAQREEERRRLLKGDEDFIKAERERTEAAARETAARAAIAEAEAAAAAAAAEREARENARSEEEERILAAHRAKMEGNTLPVRFRERDLPSRFAKLTELREQRLRFQTTAVGDKIAGLEDTAEAIASPARRASMMTDVMIGVEASAMYETVIAILDPTNPEDPEAVRELLANEEENKFLILIHEAIKTGKTCERTLAEADAKLVEMRQAVSSLAGVSELDANLVRVTGELSESKEREEGLKRDLEQAERGSIEAASERDALKRQLEAMTRKISGIVDDDFQRLLEKYGEPVPNSPLNGVFMLASPNKSSIAIVVTTTPDALPGGVVKVGDRSMPLSDLIQKMFDKAGEFNTDTTDAFFTNASVKEMAKGGGFTTMFVERSIAAFEEIVLGRDIVIDPEDLVKGE